MKTNNSSLSVWSNGVLVVGGFLIGWYWGQSLPLFSNPWASPEAGFNYKMGRLAEFNPTGISTTLKPHAIKISEGPAFLKGKRANKNENKLPEIKFIDPKTNDKKAVGSPKIKKPASNNLKSGTSSKSEKKLATPTQASNPHNSPQNDPSKKTNSFLTTSHDSEAINPIIVSGLGGITDLPLDDSSSPVNPQPTSPEQQGLSEDQWGLLLRQSPTFDHAKRFYDAYRSGEVSANFYFSMSKTLVFDPSEHSKQVGIYLLSLEISTKSFATLFEVLQRDSSLQPSLNPLLKSYQSETGVIALLPLLKGSSPEKLLLLALLQIEEALSKGLLGVSSSTLRQAKISFKRTQTWERFGSQTQIDLHARILQAIANLTNSASLGAETIELAQSIELRIHSSRRVAAD